MQAVPFAHGSRLPSDCLLTQAHSFLATCIYCVQVVRPKQIAAFIDAVMPERVEVYERLMAQCGPTANGAAKVDFSFKHTK